MKKLFVTALLTGLLSACASQKPISKVDELSIPVAGVPEGRTDAKPVESQLAAEPVRIEKLNTDPEITERLDTDPNLDKRSVYFPYDVYVVQDADKPLIQSHAQYLKEDATRKVRLEGNCDERGSNEYNLALGQRRAESVKRMLKIGGVADSQMDAVSYGEEKPLAPGHDEASWMQNRRTDLNYR